jgi:hypothetical protein
VTGDALTRLRREQRVATAALNKVKRPPGNLLTRRRSRPRFLSLGRLVAIVEAEARLAEIDEAIDQLQAR